MTQRALSTYKTAIDRNTALPFVRVQPLVMPLPHAGNAKQRGERPILRAQIPLLRQGKTVLQVIVCGARAVSFESEDVKTCGLVFLDLEATIVVVSYK